MSERIYGLDLSGLNVLVVDDNPNMRRIVRHVLQTFRIKNISEAEDGATAFQAMRLFKPDLILVDWVMAPIDGIEFVRMVRMAKDSFNPYVPIIMLTGYTEVRRVEEARDVGVNEFLAKPISAKSLYMRIAKIIREPRPFVRTKTYFGPDRRRLVTREYKGKERRLSTIAAPKIEKMDPIPMPKSMMSGILQ